MQFITWETLDDEVLTAALNVVYEGYVVPLRFTVEQMRAHISANTIRREHSLLWLDDTGAVVGLAALAIRGDRGWIGGFGITQAARGRGLSHQLIAAILNTARRLGLRQVQLEVLCHNPDAIHVYKRAGFERSRDLRCLVRDADQPLLETDDIQVTPVDVALLLPHAARLHDAAPCWQREPASLAATAQLQGIAIGIPSPRAYMIVRPTDVELRIADAAAAEVTLVPALAAALARQFPGRRMVLANEPVDSALGLLLEQQGWHELLRQYEMVYHFSRDDAKAVASHNA